MLVLSPPWHCGSRSFFFSFHLDVIIIRHQSSPVIISRHLTRNRYLPPSRG